MNLLEFKEYFSKEAKKNNIEFKNKCYINN